MTRRSTTCFAALAILATALACANPIAPAAPSNAETIVAATFAALTAPCGPGPVPGVLPHALYYLNNDSAGIAQVFRLETDGKTVTQITFEPTAVDGFDVSRLDGSVAYVSNNQLLNVDVNGANRSMLVDGGPIDPSRVVLTSLREPLWSPDGQTIAFRSKGISLYSIAGGQATLALPDQVNAQGFGQFFWPNSYSPDGSRILISAAPFNGDGVIDLLYTPNGNVLTKLAFPDGGGGSVCCSLTWTADSTALYAGVYIVNPFTYAGLYRVEAGSGQVTVLLGSDDVNQSYNLAEAPLLAPDGQLYFFFASQLGADVAVPLQLVRSAPDGVSNRAALRPDNYNNINEALWAPDASFVIVAIPPTEDVYPGGAAELVYTDPQKASVSLVPFVMQMKWGK